MIIVVLLDPRWGGGIKTFCTGALLSFLKLKELLKLSLGDVKIDFYVMTFLMNYTNHIKKDIKKDYRIC